MRFRIIMTFNRKQKRLGITFIVLAAILAAAFAVYEYFLYHFSLKVRYSEVQLPPGYESLDGKKLVLFSDLHAIDAADDLVHLRQIVRFINEEEADFIFFGGDLFASENFERQLPPSRIIARLHALHARYGVYAVTGNHDWYHSHGKAQVRELEQIGIHVLENTSVTVPGLCNVVGVQDEDGPQGTDVSRAMSAAEPTLPTLALMHRPEYWEQFPESVKLFFAGHTHGGQIGLPVLRELLLAHIGEEQYDGHEIHKPGSRRIFLSYGIGTSWIRVRINCPSEINIYEFRK